jgi:hypothetical protein
MVKDLTQEQLTPGLETGIGLGHYQHKNSDRESTIMPYDLYFETIPKRPHMSKSDHKHSSYGGKSVFF